MPSLLRTKTVLKSKGGGFFHPPFGFTQATYRTVPCAIYKRGIALLCTGKHRVWSPKRRLVRNIPETFKGLGLSQQTAFCPQKAMLAGT